MHYDSEDNPYFTTRGAIFRAEYGLYTDNFVKYKNETPFSIASANWRYSVRLNSKLTFQPSMYGRVILGNDIPFCYYNVIGGEWFGHYMEQQMPFVGIGNMEYVGNAFVAASIKLQQRIADNNYVIFSSTFAANGDKLGRVFDSFIHGYQIDYAYNSLFGPLGASLGYSSRTNEPYFYINLGYVF